jgi:hypothetical protein
MCDTLDLDSLSAIMTREINRLAWDDARRDHLAASSALAGTFDERKSWQEWTKPTFRVKFNPLPPVDVVDDIGRDVRSTLDDGVIQINDSHSDFLSRLEPGRRIGARAIAYVSLLAASEYTRFRYSGDQDPMAATERLIKLTCQLESAMTNRMQVMTNREAVR